jgi:Protein of unknown function (DUF3105)
VAKSSTRVRRSDSGGSRTVYLIVGAVIVLFVGGFIALAVVDARQQSGSAAPNEVKTYDVGPAGQHTSGDVDYEQSPPVGGEHDPVWQNCGYYDKPVRDENAVHSLEHGAVWITYSPDLPQDQITDLKNIAEDRSYILVSPYPDLSSDTPVVASAWGKQEGLDGADDPDLESFIQAYRQGPQTPEPGAVCTGGTSATQ